MSFFTQKDHPAPQKSEVLHKKMTKKVPKRAPNPAKTEVLHEKKCLFLLKKTTQPRKKLKFCIKKDKKLTKMTQKMKNNLKKPEVLHEKLKTVIPMRILKKKSQPPTYQIFKPIRNFFCAFLLSEFVLNTPPPIHFFGC